MKHHKMNFQTLIEILMLMTVQRITNYINVFTKYDKQYSLLDSATSPLAAVDIAIITNPYMRAYFLPITFR